MRRKTIVTTTLALALLTVLAVGGCSKKQVRQEAEIAPQPEVAAPAPAPTVVETPIRQEPPPTQTAAETPAPTQPVAGGGTAMDTTPGLQRIYFDFDQSVIRADMKPILQQNYDYLSRNAGVRIRIEGHCDERGTTEYNLALGERRAKSAFQYLMDLGVDPNRMSVVSYGKEQPLDPRHNEEAWAKNRRDEFVEIQR
jgi:peptidoglycan-associated lipoprotein